MSAAPALVPARKTRKREKVDTGLRPDGTIHPWKYWMGQGQRHLSIPTALLALPLSYEVLLHFGLLRMFGGKDNCYVSQEKLGSERDVSDRSARRRNAVLIGVGLITPKHRGNWRAAGRTTNQYQPIWHPVFEEAYQEKNKKLSGMKIGEPFQWSLFKDLHLPSLIVPLEVVHSRISAGAALYYGALCRQLSPDKDDYTVSASRKTLASALHLDTRLDRDQSRASGA